MTGLFAVLSFAAGTVLFSGCSGYLERDSPTATVDERWWLNESQLKTAMNNIYLGVNSGVLSYKYNTPNWWDGKVNRSWAAVQLAGLSDDAIFNSNFQDWSPFVTGGATSSHRYVHEFYLKYTFIRRASRFLDNYHRANVNKIDETTNLPLKERYAAEARAMRAYFHMELFMLFGPIPIVDHTLEPFEQSQPRASEEDLVKFIVEELEAAAEYLPDEYTTVDERWRVSKGACYAFQAQLYLFVGKYAEAAAAAKKVIDLDVYKLYRHETEPAKSYEYLFTYIGENNTERIFYTEGGNSQSFRRLSPNGISSGQANLSPTASLVNAYETAEGYALDELSADEKDKFILNPKYKPRDPRMAFSIWFPNETCFGYTPNPWVLGGVEFVNSTQFATRTGYWVKKWLNSTDSGKTAADAGSLDFYNVRYAEVLLTYVEGLVASGDWTNPDVETHLNDIRTRAGMPEVDKTRYNTQAKMLELVRRERRVELAFEGQRMFDIRRLRIGEETMNGMVYGAIDPSTNAPYEAGVRSFTARDYYWPIPITEINTNTQLVQNPGW